MQIGMSLEPAQREVAEDGSDDGNGFKNIGGLTPAFRPVPLEPIHSVKNQALPRKIFRRGFLSSNEMIF